MDCRSRLRVIGAAAAFLLCLPLISVAQEGDAGTYSIVNGRISGLTGENEVTIMVNRRTGETWFLGLIGGSVKWLPLAYSETVPRFTQPPPPNSN